jgi:hypothetical protein
MDPQIETDETRLSPFEIRHALLNLQRERMAGPFVVGWLGLLYFLVLQGGLSAMGLAGALESWWTLVVALAGIQVGALGVPVWLSAGSSHYRSLLGPIRYRFQGGELCGIGPGDRRFCLSYAMLRGVRWIDHLLAIRQADGRYLLIPKRAFPNRASREAVVRLLGPPALSVAPLPPSAGPWSRLAANLRAGLALVSLRSGSAERLRPSTEQVLMLALAALAIGVAADRLAVAGPAELDVYGFEQQATQVVALMLGALWVSRLLSQTVPFLWILVALLSIEPFISLATRLLDLMPDSWLPEDAVITQAVYLLLFLWILRVWLHALQSLAPDRPRASATGVLVLFAVTVLPFWWLPGQSFWDAASGPGSDEPRVNVEDTYYAQPQMLNRALDQIQPGRPGKVDLYFLGFGGYAAEPVFRREVEHAKQIVDARLDTRGRSLLLINDPTTLDQFPIASISNLRIALKGLAAKMDRAEDVLFLYLTSHGSENLLAVDFEPLRLNELDPAELREMLDESGIRWRVLVVSACHSGSFVDALKAEGTLVMTASAADRASFGCASENEYTYFGEALFRDAFARTRSFTKAFSIAAQRISEREHEDHETPSQPQISVGRAIGAQLIRLQRRLDGTKTAGSEDCPAGPGTAPATSPACGQ